MEYNKFGILLVLNVKSGIDENMLDKRPDYREIIRDGYMKIVNLIRRKYATCKAIMPGKLFMVYDNFALFDDFLSDILSEVKYCKTFVLNFLEYEAVAPYIHYKYVPCFLLYLLFYKS